MKRNKHGVLTFKLDCVWDTTPYVDPSNKKLKYFEKHSLWYDPFKGQTTPDINVHKRKKTEFKGFELEENEDGKETFTLYLPEGLTSFLLREDNINRIYPPSTIKRIYCGYWVEIVGLNDLLKNDEDIMINFFGSSEDWNRP